MDLYVLSHSVSLSYFLSLSLSFSQIELKIYFSLPRKRRPQWWIVRKKNFFLYENENISVGDVLSLCCVMLISMLSLSSSSLLLPSFFLHFCCGFEKETSKNSSNNNNS